MTNASSPVVPLSNWDSASQHLQQPCEHQEELRKGTRHCPARATSAVGHKENSLLYAIKCLIVDINLVVFLPV